MPNGKKEPRKVVEHYLPASYDGRCTGTENVDYVNGFPSFGQIGKLADGAELHKFEMRLPIPNLENAGDFDQQCQDLFGFSGNDMISKALEKLKTDLDELFKSYLFGRVIENADGDLVVVADDYELADGESEVYPAVTDPNDAGASYDENRHIAAQAAVDGWTYTPRQAAKTVTVSSFIQKLIASGRVNPEDLEGIETQADLFAKLAELGIF